MGALRRESCKDPQSALSVHHSTHPQLHLKKLGVRTNHLNEGHTATLTPTELERVPDFAVKINK